MSKTLSYTIDTVYHLNSVCPGGGLRTQILTICVGIRMIY